MNVWYTNQSEVDYYAGSAIYVPIPKLGVDYAKYFENIELTNPDGIVIRRTMRPASAWTGSLSCM